MVASAYVPNRGDIIWIDFSPTRGHEQSGKRPALVLSPRSYNQASNLMVACPITSKVKKYPFEVPITIGRINGVVLADQVKNLDWSLRAIRFETEAPAGVVEKTQVFIEGLIKG